MKQKLRSHGLSTVCEEAKCPNIGECFDRKTATFMIMGNVCTRKCVFCAVEGGKPKTLDPDEPFKIAQMVQELGLKHVVITSVTRDDLSDGGAGHFVKVIEAIRNINLTGEPKTVLSSQCLTLGSSVGATLCGCPVSGDHPSHTTGHSAGSPLQMLDPRVMPEDDKWLEPTIEILVPDFNGIDDCVIQICEAGPDVFNHNIETIRRLTPVYRDKASYERSLNVLKVASRYSSQLFVKSGIMVGLGETKEELEECMRDLHSNGCSIITIGQYLRPSRSNPPVVRYIPPEEFKDYEKTAYKIGFTRVFSAPLVRSSYMAEKYI